MSYYCGECVVWVGSSDVDRHGRRWCSYSRRYEESNQNTYGCKGFVYNGRVVLTKICEVLNLPPEAWFQAFDAVKDAFIEPCQMDWLANYCKIGPRIAAAIDRDENRHEKALFMYHTYLIPALRMWKAGKTEESAKAYRNMIVRLASDYQCCESV